MRPIHKAWTPAALSANGFANNVTSNADLTYTLAATVAGDGLAHKVTIHGDAATNHSAKTFTVTGIDADGRDQTEGIAGPNGAVTVTTTKFFLSISQVKVSATTGADTFDIGWDQVSLSQTFPLEWRAYAAAAMTVDISGTINFTVQETYANVYGDSNDARVLPPASATLPWVAIAAFTTKVADTSGQATVGSNAVRLLVNSVTAGATADLYITQPSGFVM